MFRIILFLNKDNEGVTNRHLFQTIAFEYLFFYNKRYMENVCSPRLDTDLIITGDGMSLEWRANVIQSLLALLHSYRRLYPAYLLLPIHVCM